MRSPLRRGALLLVAVLIALSSRAYAARQVLALYPPDILPAAGDALLEPAVPVLSKALSEKLGERFDVRSAASDSAAPTDQWRRRKARSIGASYTLTGALSRIGKGVTLDVTLAPVEDSGKGRTVVVSGTLEDAAPGSDRYNGLFLRLGAEAAGRVNELFFGPGKQDAAAGAVPGLAGTINRSGPLPGEVMSVAISDLDRDGNPEIAAAYGSGITIYRLEGDDLREEARIPDAGPGLFHIDAADIDRDGIAEIVAARIAGFHAVSDIWRFDGKGYSKVSSDLPYFLRTADLGPEGIVLLGQKADPESLYAGPIFRMGIGQDGAVEIRERQRPLPLPGGTFIYGFVPLRLMKETRYVVLSARDRLVYLDSEGKELWEGLDTITGTELALGGGLKQKIRLPGRMAAVDLNRDGNDELVVMNVLVAAGAFFESLRIPTHAELLCYSQAGESLRLAWRSQNTGNASQDLLMDRDRHGNPRFGLASRDRGKILGGATQWRILWIK